MPPASHIRGENREVCRNRCPWRKKTRVDFYKLVEKEKPNTVLHHPHTTDHTSTWRAEWNELSKVSSNVERYLSAGRFFREEGTRSNLEDVLDKTKHGDTIDFIEIT